jgi:hypothetical protein
MGRWMQESSITAGRSKDSEPTFPNCFEPGGHPGSHGHPFYHSARPGRPGPGLDARCQANEFQRPTVTTCPLRWISGNPAPPSVRPDGNASA